MHKGIYFFVGVLGVGLIIGLSVLVSNSSTFTIANFEEQDLFRSSNFWQSGKVKLEIIDRPETRQINVGKYCLNLSGQATNWYVGGFGFKVLKPAEAYSSIQMDIFGTGPSAGVLRIELIDDDNNNLEAEQDLNNNYALLNDDKFVYEEKVDWSGWKTIKIPLSAFKDDNPGVGNDKWDPNNLAGSGGLINVNFIVLASDGSDVVKLNLDNVVLRKQD